MVQVRELQRVTEEEYWRIVTDQIPVTLLGVKPHSKATDITFSIGSAALASDGREAYKHIGLFADFSKHRRFSELRDVVGDGEATESARSFSVHTALWNHFAIKVREFFQKPNILQQHRASCTCG